MVLIRVPQDKYLWMILMDLLSQIYFIRIKQQYLKGAYEIGL